MAEAHSRSRWTDERLDDLAARVDIHDAQLRELRTLPPVVDGIASDLSLFGSEVREQFGWFRTEFGSFRTELREDLGSLRAEVRQDLHQLRADMREVRTEAALNRRWLIGLWATASLGIAGLLVEIGVR